MRLLKNIVPVLFLIISIMISASFLYAQDPNKILLRDYRPRSIYKVPETMVKSASFPVIDVHSHPYAKSEEEIAGWVKTMDKCEIQKTIILTGTCGDKFDSLYRKYSRFGNRFELWCGFDYRGYDQPGFGPAAVKELERCHNMGARGVGELGDKGLGELYSKPVPGKGMHIDDPRMKPLFEKCAELGMPVNVHLADPIWMYEKMDSTNDGLMNAWQWRIDFNKPALLGFDQLIQTLENAVRNNPKTTFIACHLANCMHDLSILGRLFDKYPNLYADIAARYAETATVPRYTRKFFLKYQDRLLYGTDMGLDSAMYPITFRILETNDEHFYEINQFGYHWPLNGFDLPQVVLEKIYCGNSIRIMKK